MWRDQFEPATYRLVWPPQTLLYFPYFALSSFLSSQPASKSNNNSFKLLPNKQTNWVNSTFFPYEQTGTEKALHRSRRSTTATTTTVRDKGATTRIVAVAGQWIELQCPLASELFALTNSNSNSNSDRSIVWRKSEFAFTYQENLHLSQFHLLKPPS